MNLLMHDIDIIGLIASTFFYLTLGTYIYLLNRKAPSNAAFSGMLYGLAFICLYYLFIVLNPVKERVLMLWRMAPLVAYFVDNCFFQFAMVYPEEKRPSLWLNTALFLPAIILSFLLVGTDLMIKDYVITDPNYIYIGKRIFGPLYGLNVFYQLSLTMGGVALAVWKTFKLTGIGRQKMSFVTLSLFVGGGAGMFFSLVLPRLGIPKLFAVGPIASIVGCSMMAYGISRFKLFLITPKVAAQEIIETLGESSLVVDPGGRVLFRKGEKELLDKEEVRKIIEMTIARGELKEYHIRREDKFYVVSARFFKNGGGVMLVVHDLTELEKKEAVEKEFNKYLEEKLNFEKQVREGLSRLAAEFEEKSLEGTIVTLRKSKTGLGKKPDLFDEMAQLCRQRNNLISKTQEDRLELEKKLKEIEEVHSQFLKRELEMVELKKEIDKIKAARVQKKDQEKKD
jgi:hypothetical protein